MKLHRVLTKYVDLQENFDFRLTASAYNFSWFFNGRKLLHIVDYKEPIVAMIEEIKPRKLKITFCSTKKLTNIEYYFEKTIDSLGITEDLDEFYELWKKDPLLSPSLKHLKGLHIRSSPLWVSIIIGICQQNASFKQGWKMLSMIYKVLGRRVNVEEWGVTYLPPLPEDILKTSLETLKICGLGYRSNALLSVARAFTSNILNEDNVHRYSEDAISKIRGIGPYTARLALVLSARRYELAPIDRWLKRIVSEVYKVPQNEAEKEWKRRWHRWSGLAAVLTTIALDAEPISTALMRIRKRILHPILTKGKITPLTLWQFI
ncbi:MAG: hypothetical protein DRO15_02190 [Thermoprotei archaeon]|nr:MAG: hypothetical protein DRO15_02190 [Thermoprotei archaeon]